LLFEQFVGALELFMPQQQALYAIREFLGLRHDALVGCE
jgi:hypothetical protein